ncbi:FAD-linked oxidoreductase asqF [Colletotrichum shisoi]|uniref:FAD-linked oxidoreductase asqF n=1 Tax=Colletotrichum shisoi TaxID=2078593 RepID=A0A5Q4BKT4_9PEZI|nr:FAD-linked oxidoreductase asqF [Colletotrichum shisoi]
MAALGLMQDQASQIDQRARGSNNYTEELLGALYPVDVHLPGTTEHSDPIDNSFPSKEVVSLGPGNSWGRVYEALEKEGRGVTGGELGVVGAAGLLTGNGVSPFLGSRGFSSADVVNFEVVLAGGKIVNANATLNEHLYTIDILPFTDNLDFNGLYPAAIKSLLDIEPISSAMACKNLSTMATEPITTEFMQSYTAHINRANINVKADKELYKEITKLFFSHYQSSDIDGHTADLLRNPVTPRMVREANGKGGNPGGWQDVNQISAIRMDDEFMAKITELARQSPEGRSDAESVAEQRGYVSNNYQTLNPISDKYDRKKTLQKLYPGGYKLGA